MSRAKRLNSKLLATVAVCGLMALCVAGCAGTAQQSAFRGSVAEAADYSSQAWDPNGDCLECHLAFNHPEADDLGALHVAHGSDVTCTSCHEDSPELKAVHESADTEDILYEVNPESCLKCHSWEEVAAATEGSTAVVDNTGATVNPHTVHPAEGGAAIDCLSCHTGHEAPASQEACYTCHHTQEAQGCASCHRSPDAYKDYLTDEMRASLEAEAAPADETAKEGA